MKTNMDQKLKAQPHSFQVGDHVLVMIERIQERATKLIPELRHMEFQEAKITQNDYTQKYEAPR
jgi:hypothetical protein